MSTVKNIIFLFLIGFIFLLAAYSNDDENNSELIITDNVSLLKYETYFWDKFLPFIESTYLIEASRENRFTTGLSRGGFGALYYAFIYPDKFTYCYSMSGAVEGIATASTSSIAGIITGFDSFNELHAYTMDCEYIARDGVHDWVFWKKSLKMVLERIGQYTK